VRPRTTILLAAVLGVAACCGLPAKKPAPAKDASQAAEAIIPAALRRSALVLYQGGFCSGVIVGPHAILTAAHCHVIGNPLKVNGAFVTVTDMVDDGADHVLYRVAETFPTWAVRGPMPLVGDKAFIVGHPFGWPPMYRSGEYSGSVGTDQLWDIHVIHGDSGGGIFAANGQLVGVVSQIVGRGPFAMLVSKPLRFDTDTWARFTGP
jgi:hypothetical protein